MFARAQPRGTNGRWNAASLDQSSGSRQVWQTAPRAMAPKLNIDTSVELQLERGNGFLRQRERSRDIDVGDGIAMDAPFAIPRAFHSQSTAGSLTSWF